jgi:hypothetical protein
VNLIRSIAAIAHADFLERTRRYSFLLALLFAVFLGYATATGRVFLNFDEYRGVYTSGWVGTLVAMVITCFLTLVGFYIVKNSIERDRSTGVGQILAATPLSKTAYAFGKFFSNFAVLSCMVGVLAMAALIMKLWNSEDPRINLWALLSPFLLLALPAIALTSVSALCFEVFPLLRGGLGNVAWFFVWSFGLAAPLLSGRRWLDPVGIITVMDSLGVEAAHYVPNYHGGMSFQIDIGQQLHVVQDWHWAGIPWSVHSVLLRLMWLAISLVIVPLAALVFDRFDSAMSPRLKVHAENAISAIAPQAQTARNSSHPTDHIRLTPLASTAHASAFGRIYLAELRLALQGLHWWWYAVAAGLLIGQFAAPLNASRGPLLAVAWLWPVMIWSAMGSRESRFGTRALLFSSARILPRQLLACFLAGVTVAALAGAGAGLRLLLAHNSSGLFAWLAGALFLPAAALALGIASGTGKSFEALLTIAWYVGPMNHVPGFDFTGAANGAQKIPYALVYLVLGAAFLVAAFLFRSRQLRSA